MSYQTIEPIDPNVATREQFTNHLLNCPIPDNAVEKWRDAVTNLKDLLSKLAFHEAMTPNLQQTYMTPANSKNKIYFMWDFVGRTLGMLYQIDPALPNTSATKKAWSDIVSRNSMAASLILDQETGMWDQMVEMTYPAHANPKPTVGQEILDAARKINLE